MHIEFTLTAACALDCTYCPQQEYIAAYKRRPGKRILEYTDFKKMLTNVDHRVPLISFTGFSEPSQNPSFIKMANYALSRVYQVELSTTLWNQPASFIDQIKRLMPSHVTIHVTDSKLVVSSDMYRKAAEIKGAHFERYTQLGDSRIPADIRDKVILAGCHPHDRAGSNELEGLMKFHIPGSVKCDEKRYFCNVILPNGDCSICCMDFPLNHIIGNLLESTLLEIHNGSRLHIFREAMKDPAADTICNHCMYASTTL